MELENERVTHTDEHGRERIGQVVRPEEDGFFVVAFLEVVSADQLKRSNFNTGRIDSVKVSLPTPNN